MSTLSSLATAEQAQLRLFLSQQPNSQSLNQPNNQFFKQAPFRQTSFEEWTKPADFDYQLDTNPSANYSNNQQTTQIDFMRTNKQDVYNQSLDPGFDQLTNQYPSSPPSYSVTSDYYSTAPSSLYPTGFDQKKHDDYQPFKQSIQHQTIHEYQPLKQSYNQQSYQQPRKRTYDDALPDFEVNKRFQSSNQSIANPDYLDDGLSLWPESFEQFSQAGQQLNHSLDQSSSRSVLPPVQSPLDFDFGDIGVMDLSRLNSLGDQLLMQQANNQLVKQTSIPMHADQSLGDQLITQSINRLCSGDMGGPLLSPTLSRQHSILDSPPPEQTPYHQSSNQANQPSSLLIQQLLNQSISSPHSTLSQQSISPDYSSHRSISQASSQSSVQVIQPNVQTLAPVNLPVNQPMNQSNDYVVSVKGEGHRRLKRRLTDKQRRAKIKDGLEHLRSLVHMHGDSSTDQASVVQSSISLIKQLVQQSSNMKNDLNKLKEEGVGISIQLQAQIHAAQSLNHTFNQPINQPVNPAAAQQPVRRPLQREQSLQSNQVDAHNQAINQATSQAQSLLSMLSAQSNNQSTQPNTQAGTVDNMLLSSYLLQTIQILNQLPMARLS